MHIVFKEGGGVSILFDFAKIAILWPKNAIFWPYTAPADPIFWPSNNAIFLGTPESSVLSPDSWVHIVRCDVVPLIPMKGASADNGDG